MTTETIAADEVAQLLHCTPEQVQVLARAGEIPGLKFGRDWVFVRVDLIAYLSEKARAEAAKRREEREGKPGSTPRPTTKPRRSTPPPLPQPPRAIVSALSPRP